jgi:Protein of unknown function (DUF3768)
MTPWNHHHAAPRVTDSSLVSAVHQTVEIFLANIPNDLQRAGIAALNDEARANMCVACAISMTSRFMTLSHQDITAVKSVIEQYSHWNIGNPQDGERDFGVVYKLADGTWTQANPQSDDMVEIAFWKIEYFDLSFTQISARPWDKSVTQRLLTFMLASDY